jgi:TonB family protein
LADYNDAIRHNPYSAAAFNSRGEVFWAKGDDDRAFVDFNEAIRLDPNNAQLFLDRGGRSMAKGNQDRAMADFDQAIRLDSKFALAYRYRGNIYRAKGDLDRAIVDYDQALRINPSDTRALADRAITYDAKGNTITTYNDYQRVLVARLIINKRYPREAVLRREMGLTKVAFQIDRESKMIGSHIVTSSGYAALDQEALATVQRAQPFPPPPDQSKDHFDFVVPIRFSMQQ